MGRRAPDHVTAQQAAKILKISPSTVQHMTRHGRLASVVVRENGRTKNYYSLQALAAIADTMDKELDLSTVANMAARALAISRQNEQRISRLFSLLGIDAKTLDTSEESVVTLCLKIEAVREKLVEEMTAEEVFEWAKVFYQLTEEYLGLVARYTGLEEPWKPFLDLAQRLSEEAPRRSFSNHRALEAAFGYLEAGRKQARAASYFYVCQTRGVRLAGRLFPEANGNPDEEIMNLLFLH